MIGEVEGPIGLLGVLAVYQPKPGNAEVGVEGGGGVSNEKLFAQAAVIHTLIALCV